MSATATRTLSITVTEILYLKLVEMARKQNYTPTVYARLLLEAAYSARVATSGDKALDAAVAAIGRVQPACTEGEAMIATATKQSEREIMALRDELKEAAAEIERLRKLAKDGENFREQIEENSALRKQTKVLRQLLDDSKHERAKAIAEIARLQGEKEALLAKPAPDHQIVKILQTDPNACLAAEPVNDAKAHIDVSYHLSVADRRKVRAWLDYGMSLAECAKSLNLPQAGLAEAMRRKG